MAAIIRALFVFFALAASASVASAQQSVLFSGAVTQGHTGVFVNGGYGPIMKDAGGAGGGAVGTTPTELGLTLQGTGTAPYANAGTGPNYTNFCDYDGPTTGPYHSLCLSPNALGGGLLDYESGGGATALPFQIKINGTLYAFPPSSSGGTSFVNTTVALESLSLVGLPVGSVVAKVGYYMAGDMPPAFYVEASGACSVSDGGGCFPASTSGFSWDLLPQGSYDARWWGAISGGTDPNYTSGDTGNALAFNNMFAYASTITSATTSNGGVGGPDLTSAGLTYGINYSVNDNAGSSYAHDMSFLVLSSTNFPCSGPYGGTTAAFEISGTSKARHTARITVDSNYQPVNSFGMMSNGHQKIEELTARHWFGTCAVTTTGAVATETAGSYWIAMSNTTSPPIYTGMVLRGNSAYGVLDRSVVMEVVANSKILISKAATGSFGPNALIFDTDPSGVVFGLNNTNSGDELKAINSVEYGASDPDIGINADRYGFSFFYTGGSNDQHWDDMQGSQGVANVFIDQGTSGLTISHGEFANSGFNTTEPNPSTILITPNANTVVFDGLDINAPVTAFFDGATTPKMVASHIHLVGDGTATFSPSAVFQLYNSGTNTNLGRLGLDSIAAQYKDTVNQWFSIFGPGTVATTPNNSVIGGALGNFFLDQESYNSSQTLSASDCSQVINLTSGSAANITLPDTMPNNGDVGSGIACQYFLYAQGPSETISNASIGTINGTTVTSGSPLPLVQGTMSTVTAYGSGSNFLKWSLSPVPQQSAVPQTLTNPTAGTLGGVQMSSGLVYRISCSGAVTDTTATATVIINDMQNQFVNGSEEFVYKNKCSYSATIAAGTGVTLNSGDTFTVAAGNWERYRVLVTATGTPAVTIYSMGGGTIN